MSNRKYPRIGNWHPIDKRKRGRKCELCTTEATHVVTVQTSWFRGDDDLYWVCPNHLREARNNLCRFLATWSDKHRKTEL